MFGFKLIVHCLLSIAKYKQVIDAIHSAAVAKAVCEAGSNELLEAWPPMQVDHSEATLPRITRCVLT